jgi:hypothetical protein
MKAIVIDQNGTSHIFAESQDPFLDILGFEYSGETGFFTIHIAGADGSPQTKEWGTGEWKSVAITQ